MTDHWKKYLTDRLPEAEAIIEQYEEDLVANGVIEIVKRIEIHEVAIDGFVFDEESMDWLADEIEYSDRIHSEIVDTLDIIIADELGDDDEGYEPDVDIDWYSRRLPPPQ